MTCNHRRIDFAILRDRSCAPPRTREVDMFARHVAVKLKPDTLAEFTRVMDNEILPWLRKQKGFPGYDHPG